MAHLLIADADAAVRRTLREALEPAAHVADETADPAEVAPLVEHCAMIQDPFDLLLIGSFPAGRDVTSLMSELGAARCDHAVVLLGSHAEAPAGVLGTIDPTQPQAQIREAFVAALKRRERYLGRLGEWDLALSYLDGLSKDGLEGASTRLAEQRGAIAAHQARLASAVAATPPDEASIMRALATVEAAANEALNALHTPLEAMLAPLAAYLATPSFWATLRDGYVHDRVRTYALLAVLRRLDKDRLAHGLVVAGSHFEYPVGGNHSVFFRWSQGQRVLEDFVPAERRTAVLTRLASAPEAPVTLAAPLPTPH